MTAEWARCTLGDVLTLQRGHDLPVQDREDGGIPVVASTGVVGHHKEAKAKGPGVVIGRSGSIGGGQYIKTDFWPLNTTLWVKDFKGNDPRFCYYLLRSLDYSALNTGSGVPTLNRNHLHPTEVLIPTVSVQQAIGSFLGALDDRIALNHAMNQTLEDIARAVFKSWFIDYDPVHAKAQGKPTGLPPEIDALFPSAFVETEEGMVPEGWEPSTVGELVAERGNNAPTEGPEHYIGLADMPKKSLALTEWQAVTGEESTTRAFQPGDILFGKLRPYFHKVGVAPVNGICSTDILVLVPKEGHSFGYCTMLLSSDEVVAYADQTSTGTRMPRTSWKALAVYGVVRPPAALMSAFDQIVLPLIEKIALHIHQSKTLASLRDTLLPKLVSGELQLPVEQEVNA